LLDCFIGICHICKCLGPDQLICLLLPTAAAAVHCYSLLLVAAVTAAAAAKILTD
jgi:hypothetical protein